MSDNPKAFAKSVSLDPDRLVCLTRSGIGMPGPDDEKFPTGNLALLHLVCEDVNGVAFEVNIVLSEQSAVGLAAQVQYALMKRLGIVEAVDKVYVAMKAVEKFDRETDGGS